MCSSRETLKYEKGKQRKEHALPHIESQEKNGRHECERKNMNNAQPDKGKETT